VQSGWATGTGPDTLVKNIINNTIKNVFPKQAYQFAAVINIYYSYRCSLRDKGGNQVYRLYLQSD